MNLDEHLSMVGDYADRLSKAERATDAELPIIQAVDELYESRVWVDEWLEQSPPPKRPSNNWKPDSKSRFSNWLRWRLDQAGRPSFGWNYTYRLLTAGEVVRTVPAFARGQKLTERTLRPWGWAVKKGYADRLPQIAAKALEHVGTPDKLTSTVARQALDEWKRQAFPRMDGTPRKNQAAVNKAANAAAEARAVRRQMLTELEHLWELAAMSDEARAEFEGLVGDLAQWYDAHLAVDGGAAA